MEVRTGFVNQPGIPYRDALRLAGERGCDFVELVLDGPTRPTVIEEEQDTVTGLAADHDLDLLFHLPWALDIASPLERVREGSIAELETCIDLAAAMDGEKGVIHASSEAWSVHETDLVRDLLLEAVRELDAYARDRGVELCVENIPGGFFTTHAFPDLFSETDASMTLDTGHAVRDGWAAEDIATFVRDHGDRIAHVHVNDVMGGETDHVPFGSGMVDFEPILAVFREQDWQGTLSLEPFTYNTAYIAMSMEQLEELI